MKSLRVYLCLLAMMITVVLLCATSSAITGTPWSSAALAVSNSAVSPTATFCRLGGVSIGVETPAILQVQSNGIYYTLDSATATPSSTVGYVGSVGDIIEIAKPSLFRAIRSGGSDAVVFGTCFTY